MYKFAKMNDSIDYKSYIMTVKNEIENKFKEYGFEIELIEDEDFMDDCVAEFYGSIQDCASVFPIGINIENIEEIAKEMKMSESEILYEIKMSIAHEFGHGICRYMDDYFEYENEENLVEEFAYSYCHNMLDVDELMDMLIEYYGNIE